MGSLWERVGGLWVGNGHAPDWAWVSRWSWVCFSVHSCLFCDAASFELRTGKTPLRMLRAQYIATHTVCLRHNSRLMFFYCFFLGVLVFSIEFYSSLRYYKTVFALMYRVSAHPDSARRTKDVVAAPPTNSNSSISSSCPKLTTDFIV